jgi:hypothetical protein
MIENSILSAVIHLERNYLATGDTRKFDHSKSRASVSAPTRILAADDAAEMPRFTPLFRLGFMTDKFYQSYICYYLVSRAAGKTDVGTSNPPNAFSGLSLWGLPHLLLLFSKATQGLAAQFSHCLSRLVS